MSEYALILYRHDSLFCCRVRNFRCEDFQQLSFDQNQLSTWLKTVLGLPLYLLLDMIEEEVYIESMPSLFEWEIAPYGQRQLRKRFPRTAFAQFTSHMTKGLPWQARSGLLRFHGFNDDQGLKQLLTWFEHNQVILDGIYSLPLLLPALMRDLGAVSTEKSVVYLVRVDADHFRQVLQIDGVVQTSRFIQVKDMTAEEQLLQMRHELSLLIKFVHGQKMLDYQVIPQLLYLTEDNADRLLAWDIFKDSNFCSHNDPSKFFALNQVQGAYDLSPYEVRLSLLSLKQAAFPISHYKPSLVRSVMQLKKLQTLIFAFVAVILFTFVAYIGYFFAQTSYYEQGISELQDKNVILKRDIEEVRKQFQLETSADNLKTSVEWVKVIQQVQHNQQLLDDVQELSIVLNHFPNVQLTHLEWIAIDQEKKSVLTQEYVVHVAAVILADSSTRLNSILKTLDDFIVVMQQQPTIASINVTKKPVDIDSNNSFTVRVDDSVRDLNKNPYVYPFTFTLKFKESKDARVSSASAH